MSEIEPPPVQQTSYTNPPPPYQAPNALDRLIPTTNPKALIGYYIGLFSIMPVFGLAMGPIAIWLGSQGLRAIREAPGLPGKGHAITAIVGGIFGCLVNYGIGGIILIAVLASPAHPAQ
jgi:hypothetical protein